MSKIDPKAQKRADTKRTTGLPTEAMYRATPTTNEHTGAGQGPNKEGTSNLRSQTYKWATPDCNTSTYSNGVFGKNLREQTANWPTPRSTDDTKGGPNQQGSKGDLMLPSAAAQWPTPSASVANDGESPETWHARAAKLKEKGINGNGAGLPLTVAAVQWPTPNAMDSEQAGGLGCIANGKRGHSLTSASRQWPTPEARDYRSESGSAEFIAERLQQQRGQSLSFMVAHSSHQAQPISDGATSSEATPSTPRRLNPIFGEWLMGWPSQWTKAEPSASSASATALWRLRLAWQLSCCFGEQASPADWREAA